MILSSQTKNILRLKNAYGATKAICHLFDRKVATAATCCRSSLYVMRFDASSAYTSNYKLYLNYKNDFIRFLLNLKFCCSSPFKFDNTTDSKVSDDDQSKFASFDVNRNCRLEFELTFIVSRG